MKIDLIYYKKRKLNIHFLFLIFLSLLVNSNLRSQITSQANGNWNATATWAGGIVPGDNDAVIINHTVTISAAETHNANISGSGTLNVSQVLTNTSPITYSVSTINVTHTITGAGKKTYASGVTLNTSSSGFLYGSDHEIANGAILNTTALQIEGGKTLTNHGVINYISSYFSGQSTGVFINESDGIVNVNSGSSLGFSSWNIFTNNGVINKNGAGSLNFSSITILNNNGNIEWANGNLSISPTTFNNNGSLNIPSGKELYLGGTCNLSGTITHNGTLTLAGPTNFSNTLVLNSGPSSVLKVNQVLTIPYVYTFTIPTINVTNTITGSGKKTYASGVTLNTSVGGRLWGADHEIANGATLNTTSLNTPATFTLTNHGTINYTDGSFSSQSGTGIFINETDGVINTNSPSTLQFSSFATFTNNGVINKNGAGALNFPNSLSSFSNNGTINNISPSTTNFSSPYNGTVISILKGIGTFQFNSTTSFPSGSKFSPGASSPGKLTVNTSSTPVNLGSATYNCEINGTTAETQYDVLNSTGNIVLNNMTLDVNFGSYTPAAGESYSVVTFPSRTGQFADVSFTSVPGLSFIVSYNATNVTINAVAVNTYYQDSDGDTYGNLAVTQSGTTPPSGYVENNTDCDDNNSLLNPNTIWKLDADNDGYVVNSNIGVSQCLSPGELYKYIETWLAGNDCNNNNAAINPGATELCDFADNDCDVQVDEGFLPYIVPTFAQVPPVCIGGSLAALPTISNNGISGIWTPAVNPKNTTQYIFTPNAGQCAANTSMTIVVNPLPTVNAGSYTSLCSDSADVILIGSPAGGIFSGTGISGNLFDPSVGTQTITYSFTNANGCSNNSQTTITVHPTPFTYYEDLDLDTYGNAFSSISSCNTIPPSGYVTNNTDCNDNDILQKPGQTWYIDADGDDYGVSIVTQCLRPTNGYLLSELASGTTGTDDCDDTNPAITGKTIWYQDLDIDGFGNSLVTLRACIQPNGYVNDSTDCNDNSVYINKSLVEICDNIIDEDCNGLINEGCNCPVFDIVLKTQSEVDNFIANYNTCDSLPVSLTVGNSTDINDINGLNFIKKINGNLSIKGNSILTNINGFSKLEEVTGTLSMLNNPLLNQIDSFYNLRIIGHSLIIQNNNGLNNLNGLSNLEGINQNLTVTNNPSLNDCDALCPAWNSGITGALSISNNPSDCSTTTLFRIRCDDDCNFGNIALQNQEEVNTFINTYNQCDTLIGNLTINGSSLINSINGLSFVKYLIGNLTITNNANFSNLNGLQGLFRISGNLNISNNINLLSLDSLHRLKIIGGSLGIQNNPLLDEINSLSTLDSIKMNLSITNNINLSDCSGICHLLNNNYLGGNTSIANNKNSCSTTEAIKIICTPFSCPIVGSFTLKNQAEVIAFITQFNTCDSLIGNLIVNGGNEILDINGLSFLKYISGNLEVKYNYKITNLQGFSSLQKIGGSLIVENNTSLNSLLHLNSLIFVGGQIRIQINNALTSLSGLQNITFIGNNLDVKYNYALTNCTAICSLHNNNAIRGTLNVSSNQSPCDNNSQVNAICNYGSLLSKIFINVNQDSIAEGDNFTFIVSTDYAPTDTVIINLSSSNQLEVPMPPSIKILPNTTSIPVTIQLPNDNIAERHKVITITAGAPFLVSGTDNFVLTDNSDLPDINLAISLDTISEGGGYYATPVIISRSIDDGTTMNVTLTSSHPQLTIMPNGVNLLPGELQKQIYIGLIDNSNVDVLRNVVITARYIIPSCACGAPENSKGVKKDYFVVTDNDNLALSLTINPLSIPEGKVNAGYITVGRNSGTNLPLNINLRSNDTTELSLPETVFIPIGSSFINVPITTFKDTLEDGNQQVIITASSPGYISSTTWAIVTDINKPDLVITSISSLDSNLTLNEQIPFKLKISNIGSSATARGIKLIGYFSKDENISADDKLIGNYFIDIAIGAGDTIIYGNIGNLPTLAGRYYLIFEVNSDRSITELLYINNTSQVLFIDIQPNYTATANVQNNIYLIGDPVIITGSAFDQNGQKSPNKAIEIYVMQNEYRREIDVITNANGDYIYTLNPLLGEKGHFRVGAGYPNLNLTEIQDEYDILGVQVNNDNFITWNMKLGDSISENLLIKNLSNVVMNNVTINPQFLPEGCILKFDTLTSLAANATANLPFKLKATELTTPNNYVVIPLNVHANDTIIQKSKAYYHVKPQLGHLRASIASINVQLGPTLKRIIEFDIENIGLGIINEVNIALPNVSWMKLLSSTKILNLTPGQKKTISIEFNPTDNLPFNIPASGKIGINTTNANGIIMPFSLMKVGSQDGTMTIDVVNQYTYFSPGSPHLDSARVRISNYYTGQVYLDGITGMDGKITANNLPQGQLRIVVEAPKHKTYDNIINVSPGTNPIEVVFLEYQAITFSWDVKPTELEDEYEIDLVMKFETNVPAPVIIMSSPDTLPYLEGNQTFAFNMTLTNVGFITAKSVTLTLPTDDEYEFISSYRPQDILAKQAVQVPIVMKRKFSNSIVARRDIFSEAKFHLGVEAPLVNSNRSTNGLLCALMAVANYFYDCGSQALTGKSAELFDLEKRKCFQDEDSNPNEEPDDPFGLDELDPGLLNPPLVQGGGGGGGVDTDHKPLQAYSFDCAKCLRALGNGAKGCVESKVTKNILGKSFASGISAVKCVLKGVSFCDCYSIASKLLPSNFAGSCYVKMVCSVKECFQPDDPYVNYNNNQNRFNNSRTTNTSTDLPSELKIPLDNLSALKSAYEDRFKIYWEQYDSLVYHDNFQELWELVNPFFDSGLNITSIDSVNIVSNLENFDFNTVTIQNYIAKYNRSNIALKAGQSTIGSNYINLGYINSLNKRTQTIDTVAFLRGYASFDDMINNSMEVIRNYFETTRPPVLCASISLKVSQKLTMTREAFEGTLNISNGNATTQMDSIKLDLKIMDEQGVIQNDLFEVELSSLNILTGIDGTGKLPPNHDGSAKIIIIPEVGAAPTVPKFYRFGGIISYIDPFNGLRTSIELVPVVIQVNPSPNLFLHYFLQRDIISDDPLTPDKIEPNIPASLAVMIENNGYGVAKNLKIQSAQPKVIDNEKGLALNMEFLGSKLQGQNANMGLNNINFGDINQLSTKIGEWIFTSNILGHFTAYQTSVRHLNSRGNPDLSLIAGTQLHEWIKSIKAYGTQDDGINDFLTNEIPDAGDNPDAIYLSQGKVVESVEKAKNGSFDVPVFSPSFTNTLTIKPTDLGWNYLMLNDPGNGKYKLVSVKRNSDNVFLPLDNIWLTFVTIPDSRVPEYVNKFHFIDKFADTLEKSYTVVWAPQNSKPLEVVSILNAPSTITSTAVSSIRIVFDRAIIDSTFTIDDITLSNQGGGNLISNNIIISKIDDLTYDIDLSAITNLNGFYNFTIQTIAIKDKDQISGFYAKQSSWTQFVSLPVVSEFISFPIIGKKSHFDSVIIKFNLPIDTASLGPNDFFLIKNDAKQNDVIKFDLLALDLKTFRCLNLNTAISSDAVYKLGIILDSIKATTSFSGLDTQYYTFIVDSKPPSIIEISETYENSLDPQHVTGVKVTYDEALLTPPNSFILQRNDMPQLSFPDTIYLIEPNVVQIQWNQSVSYPNGNYKLVVNESSAKDLSGLNSIIKDSLEWITSRNSTLNLTDIKIVPDYGYSNTDLVTFDNDITLEFMLNEESNNLSIFQQENSGKLTLLKTIGNPVIGLNTELISIPTAGASSLVIKAYNKYGIETTITKQLIIDDVALEGKYNLQQNISFSNPPDNLEFEFSSKLLQPINLNLQNVKFFKDNIEISTLGMTMDIKNDSTIKFSGLDLVEHSHGNYRIDLNKIGFKKHSSGLEATAISSFNWIIVNSERAPIANAGNDLSIKDLGQINLNGSQSFDPDGDSLTYHWISLDNIPLYKDTTQTPYFNVTENDIGKKYSILLIVNDKSNNMSSDIVRANMKLDDIIVNSKIFLEGPFDSNTSLMTDHLRINNSIPLESPYTDTTKYKKGNDGKMIIQSILNISGADAIVDWVYLELYDSKNNYIVKGGSYLLQRDGDIVDIDGNSSIVFSNLTDSKDYKLRIYHRNHLSIEIIPSLELPQDLVYKIDLTTDEHKLKGAKNGVKKIGVFNVLFSGDVNQNGQIQNTDINSVLTKVGQSGYKNEDVDMDGQIKFTEINHKILPNLGRGKQH